MRDPNRIDRILGIIRSEWKRKPDMRLCQLLSSAASFAEWKDDDLFYIEDDMLEDGLKALKTIRDSVKDKRPRRVFEG